MTTMMEFVTTGMAREETALSEVACASVLDAVKATREFGPSLFLSEPDTDPQFVNVNPKPGRNLADVVDLSGIENDPAFGEFVRGIVGDKWTVLSRKFIVGVPQGWLPDWLGVEVDVPIANLGPYIKPEYRDMTYFRGVDFHQDMIDWPDTPSDFVTVYVYLADTDENASPLWVVPYSHVFGATTFPHDIEITGSMLRYDDGRGHVGDFKINVLTGPAGSLYGWHACVLHGTKPHAASRERISLRYLIRQSGKEVTPLDRANEYVRGPLRLEQVRADLDRSGRHLIRGKVLSNS